MHKVNWAAKQDFEFIANYKILQTAFTKLGIERHVDVDRLVSGRYMDNLEFMQWFKAFYERSVSDKGDYDCTTQRLKGKGTKIKPPIKPTTTNDENIIPIKTNIPRWFAILRPSKEQHIEAHIKASTQTRRAESN